MSGRTDNLTQAAAKEYQGFELSPIQHTNGSITQQTIAGDGSTTVNVFYDRKTYTLTLNGNGGKYSASASDSDTLILSGEEGFIYGIPKVIPSSNFVRSGYTFLGWTTTTEKAAIGTVEYTAGDNYTIDAADAVLYAVWKENAISITIELPDDGADVTIQSSVAGNIITLTAVIPENMNESDFTYKWFYTDKGMFQIESTNRVWTIDTTGWAKGYYQMSLLAEHTATSMLSGGTVQIEIKD